ncbi:MAG: GNAT family N-acetyltransferase [Rhodocyclales bacterium CG_4_10_14_3_um_filter_68_10]|nr:MAG: GNAT family N-acetyltransferase [Rhodocyclales bacterium CG_4_10_14_3_um_filter_68_10]
MPDMLVRLYDLPPLPSLPEGVTVRRAMPYERYEVVDWVRQTFSPGWASEVESAYGHLPVRCFIATEGGRILGFACHDATCKNFFGPTGVAEDQRGRGLGKALFLHCLHAMAADGYAYAIIGGAGPTGFYEKAVGATVISDSVPGIYRDRLAN